MFWDDRFDCTPVGIDALWNEDRHLVTNFCAIERNGSEENAVGFAIGKYFVLAIFLNKHADDRLAIDRGNLLVDEFTFVGNREFHAITLNKLTLGSVVGGNWIRLAVTIDHVLAIEYTFHYFACCGVVGAEAQ